MPPKGHCSQPTPTRSLAMRVEQPMGRHKALEKLRCLYAGAQVSNQANRGHSVLVLHPGDGLFTGVLSQGDWLYCAVLQPAKYITSIIRKRVPTPKHGERHFLHY